MARRRAELLIRIKGLSDREYQIRAWINRDYPPGVGFDDEIEVYHFFFDDTDLADDTDNTDLLENEAERHAVKNIVEKLSNALDTCRVDFVPFREYIDSPEWQEVNQAAKEAVTIFNIPPELLSYGDQPRKIMPQVVKEQPSSFISAILSWIESLFTSTP